MAPRFSPVFSFHCLCGHIQDVPADTAECKALFFAGKLFAPPDLQDDPDTSNPDFPHATSFDSLFSSGSDSALYGRLSAWSRLGDPDKTERNNKGISSFSPLYLPSSM